MGTSTTRMARRKKYIGVLAMCVLLAATCCNNAEEALLFPYNLQATAVSNQSPVRVYVKGGEIKDPVIVSDFIKDDSFFNSNSYSPSAADAVVFTSKDTAVFGAFTKYTVVDKGSQFLFYSVSNVISSDGDFSYLLDNIQKYTHPKTVVASASGYKYVTKEVRVGYGDYLNLDIRRLTYKLRNGDRYQFKAVCFNEFNPDVISKLRDGDTLAIQTSVLNLKGK